jgi:hypothetical protein
MHPSRSLGRRLVVVLAGFTVGACAATSAPSLLARLPSASPSIAAASAGSSSSATPASAESSPAGSVESSNPTEATEAPTPRPSPLAGCGTGEAGFTAHRSEIPKTLAFGHATIEFTETDVEMRDGSYVADDAIPGGIGLTPDEIAVVVRPGEHIILRAAGIALTDTQAAASPWSMVTFRDGLADLGGPAAVVVWRSRADGSLSISAPTMAGDWAISFLPRWRGHCLQGGGTAYARIKVR